MSRQGDCRLSTVAVEIGHCYCRRTRSY